MNQNLNVSLTGHQWATAYRDATFHIFGVSRESHFLNSYNKMIKPFFLIITPFSYFLKTELTENKVKHLAVEGRTKLKNLSDHHASHNGMAEWIQPKNMKGHYDMGSFCFMSLSIIIIMSEPI